LLHCVRDGPDDVVALVDNGFAAVLFIDHLALVRLVGVSLVSFALLDADDLAVRNSFFFTNLLSHLLGDRHRHCRTSLLFNIFTLLHDNILANFISNIFANGLAGDGHFNVLAGFGRLVTTLVLFDCDAFFGNVVVAVLDAAVGATVEAAEAIVRAIDIQDTWAPAIRRSFSNASISRLQMDQRADGNVLVFGGCTGFRFYDFTDGLENSFADPLLHLGRNQRSNILAIVEAVLLGDEVTVWRLLLRLAHLLRHVLELGLILGPARLGRNTADVDATVEAAQGGAVVAVHVVLSRRPTF
jgi:hypothetical protein